MLNTRGLVKKIADKVIEQIIEEGDEIVDKVIDKLLEESDEFLDRVIDKLLEKVLESFWLYVYIEVLVCRYMIIGAMSVDIFGKNNRLLMLEMFQDTTHVQSVVHLKILFLLLVRCMSEIRYN